MLNEAASRHRSAPSLRGSASLLASLLLHALLFLWAAEATKSRLRPQWAADQPTVEVTVTEVESPSQRPTPASQGARVSRPARSKAAAKNPPPRTSLALRQPPLQRPASPSDIAAPLLSVTGAGEGEQDGGAPEESVGGVRAGLPSAAGDQPAPPIVGPSYNAAYLHNPAPNYPAAARRFKLQGTATLRVLVSPEGRAQRVAVQESSGVELLDQAALDAVRQWSFVPARQGDKAIPAEVNVPLSFRLSGTAVVASPDAPN